jgi:hypothetical protein
VKIELTENEYRLLLDFVYLADWVVNAHHAGERNDIADYDMLVQKLYSFAGDMRCGELVHADRETNEYTPTRFYEQTTRAIELIEEYDEDTFWDALISRLAERDVYEQLEEDRRETIGVEEYWERSEPLEEAYYQEFRRYSLDRLRLVDG